MKIILIAFAVLVAVNLSTATADSARFVTEASAILTDFQTRIQAVISSVLPKFTDAVNTAKGSYALKRKQLNDQCSALGPVGVALGSTFVNAIKVYQSTITSSVNLALLKANATIVLNGFTAGIFAPASAGIAAGAIAISQHPNVILCWDNKKAQLAVEEANAALTFEQMVAYNLQDTADNVTPDQGQIAALGYIVDNYAVAAQGQLSYYTNNQASILADFKQYRDNTVDYLNWQLEVILVSMADMLQSDIDYVQQELPFATACVAQAEQ
jgi:hypothetical protein